MLHHDVSHLIDHWLSHSKSHHLAGKIKASPNTLGIRSVTSLIWVAQLHTYAWRPDDHDNSPGPLGLTFKLKTVVVRWNGSWCCTSLSSEMSEKVISKYPDALWDFLALSAALSVYIIESRGEYHLVKSPWISKPMPRGPWFMECQ